jgi:hypothetical protein
MSRSRIRIQFAVLAFILFPATIGIVAVRASATCERFVRTYVTKPVRNRLSKSTAEAWAAWRVAHPNWRPNPNVHRPKYVMETQIRLPDTVPPEIAELSPPVPIFPLVPPQFPLVSTVVPEPDTLLLAGTGFGFLALVILLRTRKPRIQT